MPDVLDARAGGVARILDAGPACRYLHRLAALRAARSPTRPPAATVPGDSELRRSVATCCSTRQTPPAPDTAFVSVVLISQEHRCCSSSPRPPRSSRPRPKKRHLSRPGRSDGQTAGLSQTPPSALYQLHSARFTDEGGNQHVRSRFEQSPGGMYLLFAHEPYYPGPGAREINTSVVAADSAAAPARAPGPTGFASTTSYHGTPARRDHPAGHPHPRAERRRRL
ncbi:hypothetical protein LV779_21830 [Streptomyces thinghirensis]|nr:hypothetical protein [Streptomyces thinghirensis]